MPLPAVGRLPATNRSVVKEVLTRVGSFVCRTTNGSQSITGLGFTPKVVMIWGNTLTADGSGANFSYVFATGTTISDARLLQCLSMNAANPSSCRRAQIASMYLNYNTVTGSVTSANTFTLDTDGFTLNYNNNNGTAYIINYLAIGGGGFSSFYQSTFTRNAAIGQQAITGPSFRPNLVMFHNSGTGANVNGAANIDLNFGFATVVNNRGACSNSIFNAVTPSNTKQFQSKNRCLIQPDTGGLLNDADFVTMDVSGFTIDWKTVTGGGAHVYAFSAYQSNRFLVGSFNQPIVSGSQSITGVGFIPKAVILLSNNAVGASFVSGGSRISMGCADYDLKQFSLWAGDTSGVATTISSQYLDRTHSISFLSEAGANPTLNARASITSMDWSGFTLNWDVVDSTAREILFLAIG